MRIVELKPVLLILVELILYSGQYTQNKNGFVTFETILPKSDDRPFEYDSQQLGKKGGERLISCS